MILRYRNDRDYNAYFTKKERRKREKEQVGILLNMISDVIQPGHVYKLDFKEKRKLWTTISHIGRH